MVERKSPYLLKLKKLARGKLLGDQYGKYDYVEKLLDRDFILGNPPRLVRSHLSELLDIPIEKLKYDTFIAWLRGYKKRAAKLNQDSSVQKNENKAENNISDPSNFVWISSS